MAEVTLNPIFRACHGRMGDLVHVRRYGKQHLRIYAKPANPNTPAQRERRSAFRDAVRAWQAMSDAEKDTWNALARRKRCSGYNLFLSHRLNGKDREAEGGMYPAAADTRQRGDGGHFTDSSSALSAPSLCSPSVTVPLAPVDSRIHGGAST